MSTEDAVEDFGFNIDAWGLEFTYDGFVDGTEYMINIQPDYGRGGCVIKFGPVAGDEPYTRWNVVVESWYPMSPEKAVLRIAGRSPDQLPEDLFKKKFIPHGQGFLVRWTQGEDA